MKTIRLLPIVIFSAGALLSLKTISLVTEGSFMLAGNPAVAAESGDTTPVNLPQGPTLSSESPTIIDEAPTLGGEADGARDGPGPGQEEAVAENAETASAGDNETGPETLSCLPEGGTGAVTEDCLAGLSDAVPIEISADGGLSPLGSEIEGISTEQTLLVRLAERRAELEAYAEELAMRESLVAAAEQRIEARAETMEALEARIEALVIQRDAAETELLEGVVAMYQSMRPRDAAAIFNELDSSVLVPLSKAIAPRLMAQILAEMEPARAQELTVKMAAVEPTPTDSLTPQDIANLPQIVGE